MAERVFISYRREDSRGYAGRLQGDLSRRYTQEAVFRDIEIPPGVDFAQHIYDLIDHCNIVLVMIGNGWLDARDKEGKRRLDKPDDWVRLEIERALARSDVEVIAVLAAAATALLTAFPADLIARNTVHRQPLSSNDLSTVSDFALQKAIYFGAIGALAALVVGLLSPRSRDPIIAFVLGLGAGIVAGALYAAAYAVTYLSADTSKTSSAAIGLIGAGGFLGWAFAADRPGSRLEASCAG